MSKQDIIPDAKTLSQVRHSIIESFGAAEDELGSVTADVLLSWTDDEFIADKMGGVAGYADPEQPEKIWLDIHGQGFEAGALRATAVHEHTHVWEFQHHGLWEKRWERLRGEGLAQVVAERLVDYEASYRTKYSKQDIQDYWDEARKMLSQDTEKYLDGFFVTDDDDPLPNWYGYSAAYWFAYEHLRTMSYDKFLSLSEGEVIDRLDSLYG